MSVMKTFGRAVTMGAILLVPGMVAAQGARVPVVPAMPALPAMPVMPMAPMMPLTPMMPGMPVIIELPDLPDVSAMVATAERSAVIACGAMDARWWRDRVRVVGRAELARR